MMRLMPHAHALMVPHSPGPGCCCPDTFGERVRAVRLDVAVADRGVSPPARDDLVGDGRIGREPAAPSCSGSSGSGRRGRAAAEVHQQDHRGASVRLHRRVQRHVDVLIAGFAANRPHDALADRPALAGFRIGFGDAPGDLRRPVGNAAVDLVLIRAQDLWPPLRLPRARVPHARAVRHDERIGQRIRTDPCLLVIRHVPGLQREPQRVAVRIGSEIRASTGPRRCRCRHGRLRSLSLRRRSLRRDGKRRAHDR
jgi:hypothetical protein